MPKTGTGMTTIVVPDTLAERVYEDVVQDLYDTLIMQRAEILNLRAQVEKFTTKTPVRPHKPHKKYRARRYQNEFSRKFGAMMSHLPETVRKQAREVRDLQGYEHAVDFIQKWQRDLKAKAAGK